MFTRRAVTEVVENAFVLPGFIKHSLRCKAGLTHTDFRGAELVGPTTVV